MGNAHARTQRPARPLTLWTPPGPDRRRLISELVRGSVTGDTLTWAADRVEADDLDEPLLQMLPSLYPYCVSQGLSHPGVPRIRGVYLRARMQGLMACDVALSVADIVRRQFGAEVIVLKGIALGVEYYGDLGLRPLGDADVLVPDHISIAELRECFDREEGWVLAADPSDRAITYLSPYGMQVDLHRFLFTDAQFPGANDALWEQSHTLQLRENTRPVRTLRREHHVFHAITHGIPWSRATAHRWILDVAAMARTAPAVDWDAVIEIAVRYRLTSTVATGMDYLSSLGVCDRMVVPDAESRADRLYQNHLAHPPVGWRSAMFAFVERPIRCVKMRDGRLTYRGYLAEQRNSLAVEDDENLAWYGLRKSVARIKTGHGAP